MSNQVTLEKARLDLGPLRERAHRDLVLQHPTGFGRAQPVRLTQWAQQAVYRRSTECQQLGSDGIADYEVAVALEGRDELG